MSNEGSAGNNTAILFIYLFIAINILHLVSHDNNTVILVLLLGNKNKYKK
jgi:hypothetical protein